MENEDEKDIPLTQEEADAAWIRVKEMAHLNAIEGNPLDAEDWAMFEMFYRERWSHKKCHDYVMARAREAAKKSNAE